MSIEMNCPRCNARVLIIEEPMGVPGGKDREYVHCPACHQTNIYSDVTDGRLYAKLVDQLTKPS
jgi:hypothetical protein